MTLTTSLVALVAFALVLFIAFPNRVKGFVNLFLAAESKHAEIKAAEKAGKAPPHVHGLTMTEQKIDLDAIVPKHKRPSKEKP